MEARSRPYRPRHQHFSLSTHFSVSFCLTSFHNVFMIFVAFLHSSQTDTAVLQISHLVAFPFWPMSANFRKFTARVASCAFVLLGPPSKFLVMSRTFLKLSFYLCPTRVNLCVASESLLSGQVEGAADLLVQTLAPSHFPFPEFSFRPGNLCLFGTLLQPHAPEKKNVKI